jgi:Ran GTPase-activating protein (RanGAP) involved in mRNA processing and transport
MTTLDAPAAAVLAAALRANSTLTSLTLNFAGVFHHPAAAAELLGALTGHASVRVLSLRGNYAMAAHQAAVGASLGALVAANAPALTELDVSHCRLGDDGLRALFDALPRNSHLRTLDVSGNNMSDAFARDVLLPALRANTSLRELSAGGVAAADVERELRDRAPL